MRRKSEEWVKYYLDCLVHKINVLLGCGDETGQYVSHFMLQESWSTVSYIHLVQLEICKRYFYSSKMQEFSEKSDGMK